MNTKWLNKENNKDLIVFFSGWGSNADIKLSFSGYDVLIIYDYQTIENINIDFSSYNEKYLLTWSMGVFVCNCYYEIFKDFDRLIAINGTQKIIDDNYGIPEAIYNLTIDNFNSLTRNKFAKKMSNSLNGNDYFKRCDNELKAELISIRDLRPEKLLKFNKAIISEKDRIIPTKNQINWWKKQDTKIDIIENAPHYIFDLYNNWSDLL